MLPLLAYHDSSGSAPQGDQQPSKESKRKQNTTQELEDHDESSGSKLFRYKLHQKRGKKAQDLDEYAKFVADKIEELNRLIKDPKTSVEDRKKYRN